MRKYVAAVGASSIDTYYRAPYWPELGDKAMVEFLGSRVGGMVSNAACTMAACGVETVFLDIVEAAEKELIFGELRKYNVNTDFIIVKRDGYRQSATTIYLVGGERVIFVCKDKAPFEPDEKTKDMLANAYAIYSILPEFQNLLGCGYLLQKRGGPKLVFDVEPATFGGSSEEREILGKADILFFNEQGMSKYKAEKSESEAAKRLNDGGADIVVVTKASNGCFVSARGRQTHFPALDVTAVDTTGAGDTFNSIFLFGLIHGWSIERCARMANAAGAYAVTMMGPKVGINSIGQLEQFAKNNRTLME